MSGRRAKVLRKMARSWRYEMETMDDEQRALYVRVLCEAHEHNSPGEGRLLRRYLRRGP